MKIKTSGSELRCTKKPFGSNVGIRSNNCYGYAMQIYNDSGNPYKLQPGDLSGSPAANIDDCKEVMRSVEADVKVIGGYKLNHTTNDIMKPCSKDHYVIVLLLAPGNDFHFLILNKNIRYVVTDKDAKSSNPRQSIAKRLMVPVSRVPNKERYKQGTVLCIKGVNLFSHKRGFTDITITNSENKIIFDPWKSSFDYGELNYSEVCGAFCIPVVSKRKAEVKLVRDSKSWSGVRVVIKKNASK